MHIILYYPPLDQLTTSEIFAVNIARVKKNFEKKKRRLSIKEVPISVFAVEHFRQNKEEAWNGRQIRNAFQIAVALAESEAVGDGSTGEIDAIITLDAKHFQVVADLHLTFVSYLNRVHGANTARRALENSTRYDEFGLPKPSNPLSTRLEETEQGQPIPSDAGRHPSYQPEFDIQRHFHAPAHYPNLSAPGGEQCALNYHNYCSHSQTLQWTGHDPPGRLLGRPPPPPPEPTHKYAWSNSCGSNSYLPRPQAGPTTHTQYSGNYASVMTAPSEMGEAQIDHGSAKPPTGSAALDTTREYSGQPDTRSPIVSRNIYTGEH